MTLARQEPSLVDSHNVSVFYWRTDCDCRTLPKQGVITAETSDFIIVRDFESNDEVALHKSDWAISTDLVCVYDMVADYIEAHETGDCTVIFEDEQATVLKDFLKLVLKNN